MRRSATTIVFVNNGIISSSITSNVTNYYCLLQLLHYMLLLYTASSHITKPDSAGEWALPIVAACLPR